MPEFHIKLPSFAAPKLSIQHLTFVMMLAIVAFLAYDKYAPKKNEPAVAVDHEAVAAGKLYAGVLVKTYAQTYDDMATAIAAGAKVTDQFAGQPDAWKKLRDPVYLEKVAPGLAALVPAGTEPKDDQVKAAYTRKLRAIAAGLRAGVR